MSSSKSGKRERERAKREKAVQKKERREIRLAEATDTAPAGPPERSQDELLAALDALHQSRDAERISFEEFEQQKADLLAQLQV